MVRIFLAGLLLSCYGVAWAGWEAWFEVDRSSNGIVTSVRTQDTRGNRFVIRRDAGGAFQGELYLNAYLPEPDRLEAAAPVTFSVDGFPPHAIEAGAWVMAEPYRRLSFPLGGPPEEGLSEAMIEILEGEGIGFSYRAGVSGQETVRFSFADPDGLAARVLEVPRPIDHARHGQLRAARARLDAAAQAPVDPEARRVRDLLVERQRETIRARVLERWMRPAHVAGRRCTLRITLMSTGEVLRVEVVGGSGDPDFDASMAEAARDASPLPLPADPSLFGAFQRIEMSFGPGAEEGGGRTYSGT